MSVKKAYGLAARPKAPAAAPEPEARSVAGEELFWPPARSAGMVVTAETALQFPAMLSTIVVLATDVAVLPLNVYQRLPDGSRREAPEHPADKLLSRSPDGRRTPLRWKQTWMGHALRRGNGYAEIQRRGKGSAYGLHLLDPATTRPVETVDRLVYKLGSGRELDPENVLHLAGFGPDGLCGYDFIRLLAEGIGLGMASQSYAGDYFANGAEPGGVLEFPGRLGEQAIKNLRLSWGEEHQGPGNRHKPGILEEGGKWTATGTEPEKAQLTEVRKFQAIDVARPWRVPPHKNGDFSEAHLANLEESNLDYLTTALMGWLVAIEQECNLKLISEAEAAEGYYVEHNVMALLRGDMKGRYDAYAIAVEKGWMSRDEVRRRENMNPIGKAGGGSKFTVGVNMTTLDKAGETPAAAATTPPASDPRPADPPAEPDGDEEDDQIEPSIDPEAPSEDKSPAARGTLDGNQMFSLKRVLNDVKTGDLPADAAWAMIRTSFPYLEDADIDAMINPILELPVAAAE